MFVEKRRISEFVENEAGGRPQEVSRHSYDNWSVKESYLCCNERPYLEEIKGVEGEITFKSQERNVN